MSKRTRTLLLSAVALVVLAALLVTLLMLPAPDDGETDSTDTTDTTVSLLEKADTVTVSTVTVTTAEETFRIVTGDAGDLVVEGYEDLPQSSPTYETLSETLLEITALRLIEETPDDPTTFGFDADRPATATVEVTYSDKSKFSFELGDLSPSGSGHYMRGTDDDTIYLMDSTFGDTVAAASTEYLSMAPFAAPATKDDADEVVVRDVTLSGTVRPESITFQISSTPPEDDTQAQVLTGFVLTEPYYRNLKSGTNMVSASSYYGFAANDIAVVRPTAADLKAYGFDTPYSVCNAHISARATTTTIDESTGEEISEYSFYNTFEYTIELGNELENGDRYALLYHGDEMVPLVYTVSPSSLIWVETQYIDLADPLLFFLYIDEVEQMALTADSKTTTFYLTHTPDAETRDEQLTVTADGKTYSTPDFRTLYAALMELSRTGSTTDLPTGEALLSIDLKTLDDTEHTGNIRIYNTSVGKYTVVHDTDEMYLVDAKSVDQFLSTYRKFLAGEAIE